jgi:FkbM family methyltransferase
LRSISWRGRPATSRNEAVLLFDKLTFLARVKRAYVCYRGRLIWIWANPSNEGKQIRALLRVLRFQFRGWVLRRPTLAKIGDRSSIWAYVDRMATFRVVCANPPDYQEMLVWRKVLRPGDLFVDIGANVGSYSIWTSEQGVDVIALEPAEDTFALLRDNVELNGYAIKLIQAAAGAFCGTTHFTAGLDAVNQMHPDGVTECTVVTVDSIIGDRVVGGIKVDVEGFEIDVLRGCERALSEHRIGLIQLEWNDASRRSVGTDRRPVADLLALHGYELCRPDDEGVLLPLDDVGFGPDVFARPLAERGALAPEEHHHLI